MIDREGKRDFFGREIFLVGLVLILFPFYLHTLSPSVSVGDSGEFIAAANTLALPHAPSYPLFTLLGKCAMVAIPFANQAYRLNLLSALFGVLSAALLFNFAETLTGSMGSSLIASLTFFFSDLLWEHSVSSEVFSLNGFFSLLILIALNMNRDRNPLSRRISLASFLLGLGMGNHQTIAFMAPVIALVYFLENDPADISPFSKGGIKEICRTLFFTSFFFLLGFTIYIYLPIRSFRNPPLNWSNPKTPHNLWRVITRADYGSLSLTLGEKLPRNLENAVLQIKRLCGSFSENITGAGFAFGIAGWFLWLLKDLKRALPVLAMFLISGPGFLILGNLPFDSQSNGILLRFYCLPLIPFALSLAYFFSWIHGSKLKWVLISGFFIPGFLLFRAHGYKTFSRRDFSAYDYGKNLLSTLPPGSSLYMDGGDDTFYTLAYLTMAEKKRADLDIHDRGGLIFANPYGYDFRTLTREEKDARRQKIEEDVLSVRPLFYSTFNRQVLKGAVLVQCGILYRAFPDKSQFHGFSTHSSLPSLWNTYSFRGIYESLDRPYRLRALVPLYPYLEGVNTNLNGEHLSDEMRILNRAAGFGTDISWLRSNLAWEMSLRAYEQTNKGNLKEAESLYKHVIEVAPDFESAYSNLGVLSEKEGDFKAAENYYKDALRVKPDYAEAYYDLGVLYWKESRWNDVVSCFENVLRFNPNHPQAARFLALARQRSFHR